MRYAIAILLPPLGLLFEGKVFQAFLNFILMLTLLGWPLAALWAVLVVHDQAQARRQAELVEELQRSRLT